MRGGRFLRTASFRVASPRRRALTALSATCLVGGVLALAVPVPAGAATVHTWDGNGGNNLWSNAANWTTSAEPQNGDTVVFRTGSDTTSTQNISGLAVGALIFNTSGNVITLAQPLTVSGSGTTGISASGTGNALRGTSTLTLSGVGKTINVALGGSLTISRPIAGSAGLTKTGAGTLVLTGPGSTYTGTTLVESGGLTLSTTSSDAGILGPVIVGTDFSAPGAAILTLNRNSEIANTSGLTVRFDGVVRLVADAGGFAITEDVASLTLGGLVGGGRVEVGSSSVLEIEPGGSVISTVISFDPSITSVIAGPGSLRLSSGTVPFTVSDATPSNDLQITARIIGVAVGTGLVKQGPGRLAFNMASNGYTGTTTVAQGALELDTQAADAALLGPVVVGDGAGAAGSALLEVQFAGIADSVPVRVKADGLLRINDDEDVASLTLEGTAGSKIVDINDGDDILEILSGGSVTSTASSNPSTIGGPGSLRLASGQVLFAVANGGAANDLIVSTPIIEATAGTGLKKTQGGTLVLRGNNTYTGTTTVQAGVLRVEGVQGGSPVSLTSGALQSDADATVGALTATGGSIVPGGQARGILRAQGNVSMNASTTFKVQLNGTQPGTGFDQLSVTGTVALGGATLNATLGFTPNGQSLVIVNNDGTDAVQGTFAGHPNNSTFTIGTETFRIRYDSGTGNDVVLTHLP